MTNKDYDGYKRILSCGTTSTKKLSAKYLKLHYRVFDSLEVLTGRYFYLVCLEKAKQFYSFDNHIYNRVAR